MLMGYYESLSAGMVAPPATDDPEHVLMCMAFLDLEREALEAERKKHG